MEDEERRFINSRLWSLALVEEIARADGDPAEQMLLIRHALGHFEETANVTRDAQCRHEQAVLAQDRRQDLLAERAR